MPKAIILVGPPGSGKSTWRDSQAEKGVRYVSQDEQGKESHWKGFLSCLDNKQDIIIDRMNFDKGQRALYIERAKAAGFDVECAVFHTPKSICLERAGERVSHPSIKDKETAAKVINFFFSRYEKPEYLEGFSKISYETPYIHKALVIVCDLDGTLCNIDHRLHYVKEKPKRWDLFFRDLSKDTCNIWCKQIIRNFYWGGIPTVFCSGRGEEYRKETTDWLVKALGTNVITLFMRPAKDSREDRIIKETILDFDILPQFDPLFFIDDRSRVVDMWRRRGFTCLQCAPGDF